MKPTVSVSSTLRAFLAEQVELARGGVQGGEQLVLCQHAIALTFAT